MNIQETQTSAAGKCQFWLGFALGSIVVAVVGVASIAFFGFVSYRSTGEAGGCASSYTQLGGGGPRMILRGKGNLSALLKLESAFTQVAEKVVPRRSHSP